MPRFKRYRKVASHGRSGRSACGRSGKRQGLDVCPKIWNAVGLSSSDIVMTKAAGRDWNGCWHGWRVLTEADRSAIAELESATLMIRIGSRIGFLPESQVRSADLECHLKGERFLRLGEEAAAEGDEIDEGPATA